MTAEEFVNRCLDIMGPIEVDSRTRGELVSHIGGDVSVDDDDFQSRATDTFALIAATREYQFG